MHLFLTSSPTGDLDGRYVSDGFDNRNGFARKVRELWKEGSKVLMITAFPDDKQANEDMKNFFREAVNRTNLSCELFDLWDADILDYDYSREKLHSYDVIILGGGHVPTQNSFFGRLNLREKISGFEGIVIGISAGTMNCADEVYAQPEEQGEATDPIYTRFIQGLGITNTNVLPHYQLVKNNYLDGLHLFNEISIPDSKGRRFVALIDGSYVYENNGKSTVYGEAYLLDDGNMYKYCDYCCNRGL